MKLIFSMASKEQWAKCIKNHIQMKWYKDLRDQAKAMKSLALLNPEHCHPGTFHTVWDIHTTDPIVVVRASIHAKLLVQRYPINTNRTSQSASEMCPCCKDQPETLQHFLIDCKELEECRTKHLEMLKALLRNHEIVPSSNAIVHAMFNPQTLSKDSPFLREATTIARTLIFNLHLQRLQRYSTEKSRLNSATMCKKDRNLLTYRPVPEPTPQARARTGASLQRTVDKDNE